MKQLIVCQNHHDQLTVKWDGERLSIVSHSRNPLQPKVIVMNLREAKMFSEFIQKEVPQC